jgi:hypothetical protein
MKVFALIIFLAAMQASSPVPRKTTDDKATKGTQKHSNTQSGKNSVQPSPAPTTPERNTNANPSDPNVKENIHIAPVQVVTDGWYIAYVLLTGALVLVGIYGVCMAKRTLTAIERQAKANEDQLTEIQQSAKKTDRMILLTAQQTENVKKSTDALINSERSWIMTELNWQDGHGRMSVNTSIVDGEQVHTSSIYIVLKGKNEGRTPAWITSIKFWCKLYTESPPAIPDIARKIAFSHLGPEPLRIAQPRIDALNLTFEGQRTQVLSALLIYGVVEYRDVFGDHETWCGYIVRGDPESLRLQRLAGYPEYNKNT